MTEDEPADAGCRYHSHPNPNCPHCAGRAAQQGSTYDPSPVPSEEEIAYFLGDAEAEEVYPSLVDVTLSVTIEADDCQDALEAVERHFGEANLGICQPTIEKAERRDTP